MATGPYVGTACGRSAHSWQLVGRIRMARKWRKRHEPDIRAAVRLSLGTARHEADLRAVRRGEDAAVKLAIRCSLVDVAEAAHQEDAVALDEALTRVESRGSAPRAAPSAQRAARDRRLDDGHHVARRDAAAVAVAAAAGFAALAAAASCVARRVASWRGGARLAPLAWAAQPRDAPHPEAAHGQQVEDCTPCKGYWGMG